MFSGKAGGIRTPPSSLNSFLQLIVIVMKMRKVVMMKGMKMRTKKEMRMTVTVEFGMRNVMCSVIRMRRSHTTGAGHAR